MKRNRDYTGSQRLVQMYIWLSKGQVIRPTEYARRVGISRQTVYHQLMLLSSMGVDVVNESLGRWTLREFLDTAMDVI